MTITSGRARATAEPDVAAALQHLLGQDVGAWPGLGLVIVKERTVRTVLRGRIAAADVHVKVFRACLLSDHARDALRGPRGEREAANLRRAQALGLPVVTPLAFGMVTDGAALRSFVMTRTVTAARPFDFAMPAAVHHRVGSVLRTMHDRGVLPPDLHPGNLIVDGNGDPWLLDLTSLRHGGEPDLVQRARALAFFCQSLDGGGLDRRARELLTAYLGAGPSLPARLRQELALATHRWRAAALPAFGRRSTRDCRQTEVGDRRRGEPRWHWHRDATPELRALAVALATAPPPPHKAGRRGSVWLTERIVGKQRAAGAARRLWRAAYWLLFAGVRTATPVALRTFRGAGLVCAERVTGEPLAVELAHGRLAGRALLQAASSLGTSVGRLHAHGLRNRDLKFENLVREPRTGEVAIVDLDGVRRKSATDVRGRGADLGRLLAAFRAAGSPGGARTARTFLRAYLHAHRALLQRAPLRRLGKRAEQRAAAWASAHRSA